MPTQKQLRATKKLTAGVKKAKKLFNKGNITWQNALKKALKKKKK